MTVNRFFLTAPLTIAALLLIRPMHAAENSSELCRQGLLLAASGKIDEAIPLFQRSTALSPRYALAHYGLGRCYLYKEGKAKDASRSLAIAVECDRKLAKGYFYLGFAWLFQKKYDYSISAFYSAYTVDKTYREALYNIGAVYDIMGHDSKSLRFFREFEKAKRISELPF